MSLDLFQRVRTNRLLVTLSRRASGALAVRTIGAGLALAVQLLLTRVLGVEHYGMYVYSISWLVVVGLVARLGLDSALIRLVAVYDQRSEWSLLRGLLETSNQMVVLASLSCGAIMAGVVWLLRDQTRPELTVVLGTACLAVPVYSLVGLRQGTLRGLGKVPSALALEMLILPAALAVTVLTVAGLSPGMVSSWTTMLCHLGALVLTLALGGFWTRGALPAEARAAIPTRQLSEWLRIALPMLFISGMAMVLVKTDVLMIGALIGTTAAGNYAVAVRLASLVAFGLAAATATAAPTIAASYARGEIQELKQIAHYSSVGIAVFSIPVGAVILLFGEKLLGLFDPAYREGYAALTLLVGGQLVNALCGSVMFFMTMTGHEVQAARVTALVAITNIALNWLLIPRFGLAGAGAATATSTLILNVSLVAIVRRRIGLDPSFLSLFTRSSRGKPELN